MPSCTSLAPKATHRTAFAVEKLTSLKRRGTQRPIVAGVGQWRSLASRGYVETALEVERDMSRLLIETEVLSDEADVLAFGKRGLRCGVGQPAGVSPPFPLF